MATLNQADPQSDNNEFAAVDTGGGLTTEEQAQFDAMRGDDSGATETPEPDAVVEQPVAAKPAVEAPAGDGEGDEDGDDEPVVTPEPGTQQQQHLGPDGKPLPRRVNRAKYERQLTLNKKLQDDLAKEREDRTRISERYKMIAEALQAPAAAAPKTVDPLEALGPAPDPEEDIIAFSKWNAARGDILAKRLEQFEQGTSIKNEETELRNSYQQDAQVFAAKTPDFWDAYKFLMDSRLMELAVYMFGLDPTDEGASLTTQQQNQLVKAFNAEEAGITKNAQASGRSPAQMVYMLAQGRGFTGKAAPIVPAAGSAAAPAASGGAPGNLADAAAVGGKTNGTTNGAAKPNVTEALQNIRDNKADSLSLSDGGGVPASGVVNGQRLERMSDKEFAHFMETASDEEKRAALGA